MGGKVIGRFPYDQKIGRVFHRVEGPILHIQVHRNSFSQDANKPMSRWVRVKGWNDKYKCTYEHCTCHMPK